MAQRIIDTDADGNSHEHLMGPQFDTDEAVQKHVDKMNEWTHRMMSDAIERGAEMSPDWYDGKMPNSRYVVSWVWA